MDIVHGLIPRSKGNLRVNDIITRSTLLNVGPPVGLSGIERKASCDAYIPWQPAGDSSVIQGAATLFGPTPCTLMAGEQKK